MKDNFEMMQNIQSKKQIIGWIFILAVLISGWLIAVFEEFNLFFLFFLLVLNILIIYFRKSFGSSQVAVARFVIAAVFIFSGFVKGVDPLGTQYRLEDYFTAFGTEWAKPFSLILSVLLNGFEFIIGIMLLLNLKIKLTIWITGILMANFTILTLNDALYEPVPDCGCFGDALIISNWQTFYKNLVIDALFFVVFFARNRIRPWMRTRAEWGTAFAILLAFTLFQIYNIRHLPVIDFSDWKVGNKMAHDDPQPMQFYLTYQNIQTGEQREYLSPNYPYDDPEWMANWEFVSQRVIDPNPPLHELNLDDESGNDHTAAVIENPDFQFILVAYYLDKTNLRKIAEIRAFINACIAEEISFVILTSSLPEEAHDFREKHDLDAEFYFADDVNLKAMIRSNPGLLLMKDAVVLKKWHNNDFPDYEEFAEKFRFGNR